MSNRLGLNINAATFNKQEVLNMTSGGASSYVIMNDVGMAQEVAEAQPDSIVISRADWPDDNNIIPPGLLRKLKDRHTTAPDVYHYWPNEPYIRNDPKKYLDGLADFCPQLADAGLKGCVGNFSAPSAINPPDVYAGHWDNFLRVTSEWSHAGHGVVGIHEYMSGALPYGCANSVMDVNDLKSGEPLKGEDEWPSFQEIWNDYKKDYHNFRYVVLAQRCSVLGIECPRFVLTECFWDRMTDDGMQPVLQQMDAWRGGKPQGGDGGGSDGLLSQALPSYYPDTSQPSLFKRWWPQWSPEEAALKQMAWAERTYSPHVLGFCFFQVTRDPKWKLYNLAAWPDVLNNMPSIPGGKHL